MRHGSTPTPQAQGGNTLSSLIAPPSALQPRQTSLFVNGYFPRRRLAVLLLGTLGGLLIAYLWSAQVADDDIGFNTANAMLGHTANSPTAITGIGSGILFAFVAGLAGSFTACNIAVFGAVGPLAATRAQSRGGRFLETLKPLGWMTVGMVPVSAIYGALVGIIGTRMPQFSTAPGHGYTPRTIQTMIAFGIVGVVMVMCGLAALGMIPDPLARISSRFQNFPLVMMGALVGAFLIGRPYPLFRDLFRHAANEHNALYGAGAFVLQSIGNMIVMGLLFVLLSYALGGRVQRWVADKPERASTLTASAFLVAGVFTLAYWELKVMHRIGDGWFPTPPWH
jgi:hypothetical protein